jgi:hypothetical protein
MRGDELLFPVEIPDADSPVRRRGPDAWHEMISVSEFLTFTTHARLLFI